MRKRLNILLIFIFTAFVGTAQTILFSEDFGSSYSSFYPGTNWECKHSSASSYNTSSAPCGGTGDYAYSLSGINYYITTKQITLGASGNQLSFDYSFDYSISKPQVLISTIATCGSTGTDVTGGGLAQTATCDNISFNLDAYANQTIRIIFIAKTSTRSFNFDNILVTTGGGGGSVLYEEGFTTTPLATATSSGWTRNNGTTYACTGGDYAYYSSGFTNYYFATDAFHVPRGKGVNITFDMKRLSGTSTLELYARVGGYGTWNTTNRDLSGWLKLSTSHLTYSTSCSSFTVSVPGEICGGQDLSILFRATGTNITIDNIEVSDNSAKSVVPDISTTPLTYDLDASGYFWGPEDFSSFRTTASSNKFSYRTYYGCNNSEGAYAYITSVGGNGGQVNVASVSSNRHLAFFNTSNGDCTGAPGGAASIITREFNTSGCSGTTATLRFAFKASYSGHTFDETYTLYTPRVFYAVTHDGPSTGLTWVEANVNYYFPNQLWWYATTSLPKEQNLVVAFVPRSGRVNDFRIDDIKILCSDCSINSETGGAISCTSHPGLTEYIPDTEYTFTIGFTNHATHYKWIVRDITTSEIYYGTTAGVNPAVVSGQGTQTATINFGTTGGTGYRVMCIPYDSDYGTDAAPTDACYAKISYYSTLTEDISPTPVSFLDFAAQYLNGEVFLSWQTASETNNDYFVVQNSENGKDFIDIAIVDGAGNSNTIQSYQFETEQKLPLTYYRLNQVDFDGTQNFSKIIAVQNQEKSFEIFINHSDNNIIYINSQQECRNTQLLIIDVSGKTVFSQKQYLFAGENKIMLNNIEKGICLVSLIDENSQFRKQKRIIIL